MSQNEFESHNVPHAHSSSPPPGLDSVRKSPVFRLIAAMLMIAAVATLIGIFALWPNNERSEEIQRNAEDIALTSDLLKATVHEASESICGYSISSEVEMCRNVTVVVQEGQCDFGLRLRYKLLLLPRSRSDELSVVAHPAIRGHGYLFSQGSWSAGTVRHGWNRPHAGQIYCAVSS